MPQTDELKAAADRAGHQNRALRRRWPKEGMSSMWTLIKKFPRKAYFDMGRFGTGIVFGAEDRECARSDPQSRSQARRLQAKIVALDGEEGRHRTFALRSRQAEALGAGKRTRRSRRSDQGKDRRGECRRPHDDRRSKISRRSFPSPSFHLSTIRKFRTATVRRSRKSLRSSSARNSASRSSTRTRARTK